MAHGLPELNPLPLITNELPPFCGVTVIVGCNVREQPDSNTAANIGNTTKRFIVICKNQLGIFLPAMSIIKGTTTPRRCLKSH